MLNKSMSPSASSLSFPSENLDRSSNQNKDIADPVLAASQVYACASGQVSRIRKDIKTSVIIICHHHRVSKYMYLASVE